MPGVLFSSAGLRDYPHPSYRDFPVIAIDALPTHRESRPPRASRGEEQETVDERLKSLGYF